MGTGYVTRNGKIARKVIGGALSGFGGGVSVGTVVAYYLGKLDPTMPTEIRTILVGWVVGLIVLAFSTVGAILTAPDSGDVPVPE